MLRVKEARRLATGQLSERDFMQQVMDLAALTGWLCFHVHDSRKSTGPGFPDVILVRGTQLLAAELKSEKGRLSPAQQSWIEALRCAGVECHIWRPADFDAIVARLTTGVDSIML